MADVIDFNTKKKLKEEESTEENLGEGKLIDTMRRNKANKEREEADRKRHNEKVKRGYRLKPKGKK